MHELGITKGILDSCFDAARDAGAERIIEIRVTIGDMTEVVETALQFAFEALVPGTMAEGARLHVTNLPPRSRCLECQTEYEHDRYRMTCPNCGSLVVELLQGRELQIDSIETEDPPGVSGQEG